ncbi:MAG: hexokinase [Bacteroidales bacterium]|nr:hexokinase [Bacteroidales bacterium]
MKNQFDLSNEQLIDIANSLTKKVVTGLQEDGTEIKCLPTYIHPKKDGIKGQATVFDLGGTNFRVATVSVGSKSEVTGSTERDITEMKNKGFTREDLFNAQAKTLSQVEIPKDSPIGYCFSYPAKSLTDGDAELIHWTKGVGIDQMEGKPVGKPLLKYLNENTSSRFTGIRVVNDTITSLFAGLLNPGFDAYIGLIVGTGTNMATFFPSEYIPKIRAMKDWSGDTPVNLESGNFFPPHLTAIDDQVDASSNNKGFQRFEKAISGMYLGRVFMEAFPNDKFDEGFSAVNLTRMINNPGDSKPEYVEVAYQIYERSAKLVAASIAGLVKNLKAADPATKKVQVLAEGSLFWSKIKTGKASYAEMVDKYVNQLVKDLSMPDVTVKIARMENANLIGAAMAVLS